MLPPPGSPLLLLPTDVTADTTEALTASDESGLTSDDDGAANVPWWAWLLMAAGFLLILSLIAYGALRVRRLERENRKHREASAASSRQSALPTSGTQRAEHAPKLPPPPQPLQAQPPLLSPPPPPPLLILPATDCNAPMVPWGGWDGGVAASRPSLPLHQGFMPTTSPTATELVAFANPVVSASAAKAAAGSAQRPMSPIHPGFGISPERRFLKHSSRDSVYV